MGYKVIFAPQAYAQLEEIVRFIAQDTALRDSRTSS